MLKCYYFRKTRLETENIIVKILYMQTCMYRQIKYVIILNVFHLPSLKLHKYKYNNNTEREYKVQFGLNETVSISVFVVRLKSFEKLVISNNNNMMKWASENYIRFYVTKDQARDKASATK